MPRGTLNDKQLSRWYGWKSKLSSSTVVRPWLSCPILDRLQRARPRAKTDNDKNKVKVKARIHQRGTGSDGERSRFACQRCRTLMSNISLKETDTIRLSKKDLTTQETVYEGQWLICQSELRVCHKNKRTLKMHQLVCKDTRKYQIAPL